MSTQNLYLATLFTGSHVDMHQYFLAAYTSPLRAAIGLRSSHRHSGIPLNLFGNMRLSLMSIQLDQQPDRDCAIPESTWNTITHEQDDIEDFVPARSKVVFLLAERNPCPPYVTILGLYSSMSAADTYGLKHATEFYKTVCVYPLDIEPGRIRIAEATNIQTRDYTTINRLKRPCSPAPVDEQPAQKRARLERAASLVDPIPHNMPHDVDFSILPSPSYKMRTYTEDDVVYTPPCKSDEDTSDSPNDNDALMRFFEESTLVVSKRRDDVEQEQEEIEEFSDCSLGMPTGDFILPGSREYKLSDEDELSDVDDIPSSQMQKSPRATDAIESVSMEVRALRDLCSQLSEEVRNLKSIVISSGSCSIKQDT